MSAEKPDISLTSGASFTQPMGLLSRIQRADTRLDFVPVLDIVVIAMLISLLFTRFVILPGIRVDLPVTDMRMQHSPQTVAVLTIGNSGMLFFDGGVYEADSIEAGFEHYIATANRDDIVLLVKAEHSLDLQAFLQLCHDAKQAGFVQVQLAGRKASRSDAIMPVVPAGPEDGGMISVF
ncbi:MAG: ExbD/TolR family protein [Opitutales bacterium]